MGNTNALKHGYYSKYFHPSELAGLDQLTSGGLAEEIELIRVLIRRMMKNSANGADPVACLNAISQAAVRIGSLMRIQALLRSSKSNEFEAMLDRVIEEVAEELKLKG